MLCSFIKEYQLNFIILLIILFLILIVFLILTLIIFWVLIFLYIQNVSPDLFLMHVVLAMSKWIVDIDCFMLVWIPLCYILESTNLKSPATYIASIFSNNDTFCRKSHIFRSKLCAFHFPEITLLEYVWISKNQIILIEESDNWTFLMF